MKSPVSMAPRSSGLSSPRRGYTIVEMLVATALTLLLMAAVVTLFGSVTQSVSRGQAMMETVDRVRATQHRLQLDLKYVTARMVPPLDPEDGLGYFEIIEGAGSAFEVVGGNIVRPYGLRPINTEAGNQPDTSVGDVDDVVMFTARSYGEPFVGRWGSGSIQSQVAEIAWFLRGSTLYRRVLLVGTGPRGQAIPAAWYPNIYLSADLSVRQEGGSADRRTNAGNQRLVPNTLGDLTKRENRYAHEPFRWPHHALGWGHLGLPTLRESAHANWPFPYDKNGVAPGSGLWPSGQTRPGGSTSQVDFWFNPHPWSQVEPETGTLLNYFDPNAARVAEDVILNNVVSFDVKVWDQFAPVLRLGNRGVVAPGDPGYREELQNWAGGRPENQVASRGAYVDLFYGRGINQPSPISLFSHGGDLRSGLQAGGLQLPAMYDTGSTHYERDGVGADAGTDGIDNNNQGGADDASEIVTPPPYAVPLRGVQIKIRVYEPDSRQIREVTVTQDFLK